MLMLETHIPTTQPLPEALQWLDQLKANSELIAQQLDLINPSHAERIRHCADWVRIKRFKNGFIKLDNRIQRFCRLRGCPLCETIRHRKLLGRIAQGLVQAKATLSSYQWMIMTLGADATEVTQLRSQVVKLHDAFGRLQRRKDLRAKGIVRLTNLQTWNIQIIPSMTLLCFVPKSMAKGRHYLSIAKLQTLWEECLRTSAPTVKTLYLGQNRQAIFNAIRGHGTINLTQVDSAIFADYYCAIQHLNLVGFSGVLNEWMQERECTKPSYYPSEQANLKAMEHDYFAFLPNPDHPQHDNQFLLYPELYPADIVDGAIATELEIDAWK